MAIFEKSFDAVKEFHTVMNGSMEGLKAAKEEISVTFKSPVAEEKTAAVKKVYDDTFDNQRIKAEEIIKADFADVRSQVHDVVTAAAPDDFPATLEAIKAKGESISDYECRAFLQKYKGNYLAFSALVEVFHRAGKAGNITVIMPDHIEEHINELEKIVMRWLQNYHGSEYLTALLTDQQHTLLLKTGKEIQAFIDGDFYSESTGISI